MKINNNILILIIILGGAILRLWNLSINPPHLTPDEAAIGYNAYSIMLTGKDEHGEFLPFIFKSFGDFKPGLYIYLTVPFVALFGLTEFAVRLPSALCGILAIFLIYKLTQELRFNKFVQFGSAIILALSPWHIQFSRGAWEANFALTLTMLGLVMFLKSINNNRHLIPAVFFFGLSLIAYQGAKLSTAIVVGLCLLFYWKNIIKYSRKVLYISAITGLITSIPIVLSFFSDQVGRLGVFSVFSYPRSEEYIASFINESGVVKDSLFYKLFYSEPLNFLRGILGRYSNHFSARFLFFDGDWQNPMFTAPNHGVSTLADLPLLILGAFTIFKKIPDKKYLFILLWLILAPLPAVLSRDQVQAVRSLQMVIPLTITFAIGLGFLISRFKKYRILPVAIFLSLYIVSYLYYLDAYFVHFPVARSASWSYGYKQIVESIAPIKEDYNKIKVEQSYAQPYIYFLFYEKVDPAKYQQNSFYEEGKSGDVGTVKKLDKIEFVSIHGVVDFDEQGIVAAKKSSIPAEKIADQNKYKIINEINYQGTPEEEGFIVFSVNPNENE